MPCALLSVHDKTGIIEFAQGLQALGWRLLASGNTARLLREHQLNVTEVADYTQSPEILGGRVKTLHPAIHGGLLARPTTQDRQELQQFGWDYIDLVAVNLYPFTQVIAKPDVELSEAIENIDIGGVALIRAAAKNHARVTLVCDPQDYSSILQSIQSEGEVNLAERKRLAVKGFAATCRYDAAISEYLSEDKVVNLTLYPVQNLRYGENPHQAAALYSTQPGQAPMGGELLQGKELSYNNLLDLDAAWRAVLSFKQPAVCVVKHVSPCGIASAETITQALQAAIASDPISAFGGIIACNHVFDEASAEALGDLFVECIVATDFTMAAREILAKRKNCRLLKIANLSNQSVYEWRTIYQGWLKQYIDYGDPQDAVWQVVSKRQPSAAEWEALRFAWIACQHVKSNAIVLAQAEATIGIGGGQPNRIDCVKMAIERAGQKAAGAVMASDAFFPFPDCVTMAAAAGITAVIQPGGSIRDAASIAVADANDMAMVVTGVRHFRH